MQYRSPKAPRAAHARYTCTRRLYGIHVVYWERYARTARSPSTAAQCGRWRVESSPPCAECRICPDRQKTKLRSPQKQHKANARYTPTSIYARAGADILGFCADGIPTILLDKTVCIPLLNPMQLSIFPKTIERARSPPPFLPHSCPDPFVRPPSFTSPRGALHRRLGPRAKNHHLCTPRLCCCCCRHRQPWEHRAAAIAGKLRESFPSASASGYAGRTAACAPCLSFS